jgi:hypothetical protein
MNKNISNQNRRSFLRRGLIVVAATPIFLTKSDFAFAEEEKLVALPEDDTQAKALGYVEDASKVDKVKFPKKAAPDGDKQKCSTCMLLQKGGLKADGKEGEYGKCSLFQKNVVAVNGWCNSWVAKPAV